MITGTTTMSDTDAPLCPLLRDLHEDKSADIASETDADSSASVSDAMTLGDLMLLNLAAAEDIHGVNTDAAVVAAAAMTNACLYGTGFYGGNDSGGRNN